MVKKIQKQSGTADASPKSPQLAATVRDSAQQIWLAGLGAFSKAQAEGGKVFEALVKQGVELQRKTQTVAEERFSEATGRMTSMANDISSKASGQWDKLETIFEDRVAKALAKLGVPSAKDVNELSARVDELNRHVQKLVALKTVATKTPARKTPASKSVAAKKISRKTA